MSAQAEMRSSGVGLEVRMMMRMHVMLKHVRMGGDGRKGDETLLRLQRPLEGLRAGDRGFGAERQGASWVGRGTQRVG